MTPLENLVRQLNIRMSLMPAGQAPPHLPDGTRAWLACFFREAMNGPARTLRLPLFTARGATHSTAADLLRTYADEAQAGELGFYDFCRTYKPATKEALPKWRDCRKVADAMRDFLGPHYSDILAAEHSS